MDFVSIVLVIIGLTLFETINSLDNAIINSQVLATTSKLAQKWFLGYGLFIAVFLVRGLLPFLIVWVTNTSLGPLGALTVTFSSDPKVRSIEASAPVLLIGGGIFLIFLFFIGFFWSTKNLVCEGNNLYKNKEYGFTLVFQFC